MIAFLIFFEILLNTAIIYKVPYTEIDYIAYMQEVGQIWNGERDYLKIYGDTGPLVYPAGFVYVFGILYALEVPKIAVQSLFAILHIATVYIVFKIYTKSQLAVPLFLLVLSRRIHSIYVLRCFNDPVAMLFLYTSILSMLNRNHLKSTILFSVALSVKMNVLLFFPGFAIVQWKVLGAFKTIRNISLIILIQALLALPFLIEYPWSYVSRAFDFGRQFDYMWTVNWKMFPPAVFYSSNFSRTLLILHIATLFLFVSKWCKNTGGIWNTFWRGFKIKSEVTNDEILFIIFTSNFVGILFARSLHYQFYSWYFHTLPYLLWRCDFAEILGVDVRWANTILRCFMLILIEYSWNVFPSNSRTSLNLLIQHSVLLIALLRNVKNKSQ